jgi:hypothetical protein
MITIPDAYTMCVITLFWFLVRGYIRKNRALIIEIIQPPFFGRCSGVDDLLLNSIGYKVKDTGDYFLYSLPFSIYF